MKLSELNYKLPKSLIAQSPTIPRDHSRLMLVDRATGKLENHYFYELPKLLKKDDVLVFNESKVFPARVFATKRTGGKVELLLLTKTAKNTWEALRKGKVSFGQILDLGKIKIKVVEVNDNVIKIKFSCRENDLFDYLEKNGFTPLPPYIEQDKSRQKEMKIRDLYQTIYAKTTGSAAAPTAGLHFTKSLIGKLKDKRITMECVTLHVGLGTFAPVKEATLEEHKIHSEYYWINPRVLARLRKYKKEGRRIIAVGTTSTRVLETIAGVEKTSGGTSLFIYPPYKFKFVDGLVTNFHLPKSTLIALVYAFAGKELTRKAYKKAIHDKYRFYSFGDASLIV